MVKEKRRKKSDAITKFKGRYYFLSNFFPCEIHYHDKSFPTVENVYQALKTDSKKTQRQFMTCSPTRAKRLGQRVKLIQGWDESKVDIMHILLMHKFSKEPFNRLLLSTGNRPLIEGNTWHDNFWGNCNCSKCISTPGQNFLGKLLMDVRKNIVAVVNIREHLDGIYCGRSSMFGNPYVIGKDGSRKDVIRKHHKYFHLRIRHDQRFREHVESLRGRFIFCHCYPLPCHLDAIARYLHKTYIENIGVNHDA